MASISRSPRFMVMSETTGNEVVNNAGENLGKIEEFVVDQENGRIAYALLSFGGFLGVGNKWFAIPWEALKPSLHDKKFILNVDKEMLKSASGFIRGDWPDYSNPEWARGVYTHYGYKPYWIKD